LARQKALDARTVDYVNAGEEQNERDHNLKGENTNTREFNGRTFRFATSNGWFSWELKILPNQPQELLVTYLSGGRSRSAFDVLVDDTKLATESASSGAGIEGQRRGANSRVYPLSVELLKGKDKIKVKFPTPANSRRGSGVYGVRVLKKNGVSKSAG
jgi:hypothetical protein